MDDVNDLLKTWELEELIPIFNQQQITIQALSALTDGDVKEIIPLAGPRSLFMRCWRTWKAEFSSTLLDLSMFEVNSLDPKDIIIIPPDKEKENQPPTENARHSEGTTTCWALENLLKESLDSASLLACQGHCLPGDSARNLLAAVIAKAILKESKDSPIRGATYYKWVNYIKEVFPGERTTTYYIPACTTANGIVLQAKGKLVHQVLNKRRRLQNIGALPKGKGKRSREESPTTSLGSIPSPRPIPSIFLNEEESENFENDLQWLENSSEPWNIVVEKWVLTYTARTRKLYDTKLETTIESYFDKYPALKKPQGYSLLHEDFNTVNGIYKDNLFINFPLLKIKLLELLKKKKTTEPFYHEQLITLVNSSCEESSNLAGFLTIPFLLNTATVKQKKHSSGAGQSWKPSKIEVREGFIKHVKSSTEIGQLYAKKMRPPHVACAVSLEENVCVWDAGAALVVRDVWGRWQLLGMSVRGPGCGAPSRFLDMMSYYPWVESSLSRFRRISISKISKQKYIMRTGDHAYQKFGNCDEGEKINLVFREMIVLRTDNTQYQFLTYNLTVYDNVEFSCLTMELLNASAASEMRIHHHCVRRGFGVPCYRYKGSVFEISVYLMFSETCRFEMFAWGWKKNMTLLDIQEWKWEEGTYYEDFTAREVEYRGPTHQTLYGFEPLDESMWVPEYDVWSTTPPPDPNATTTTRRVRSANEQPSKPDETTGDSRLKVPKDSLPPPTPVQYMTGKPNPRQSYRAPTTRAHG